MDDMKELTKEQLDNLWDFSGSTEHQALRNGEVGYCKSEKILIVCCSNCGDYTQIEIIKKD